nr:dihydroorotate dehydrogenase electron transfer subunit [Alkalibacter mobilis]
MFLMITDHGVDSAPGQFYMVRGWDKYPLLSRPISIFDSDGKTTKFLYRVVGEGTDLLSKLKPGDEVQLQGPYGNGFPEIKGNRIALVGGGIGTAPLYLAAKEIKRKNPEKELVLYLGFENSSHAQELFEDIEADARFKIGGYITDIIDFKSHDAVLTCGPEAMMKAVFHEAKDICGEIYVSMEKRMACGVGACLGCTCETKAGNRRTCKDGPVFEGSEVFFE